jgi:5-(carboxyamino)imidazole ribonucleotide synthase
MEGRGVYGVELFERADGVVLLNEVAPRPHNSGHWTIEGCHTSQFEQHVRAVTGRPLGATERRVPTASANILCDVTGRQKVTLQGVDDALARDRLALHWYGKREGYRLRKMGHITRPAADDGRDPTTLLEATRAARDGLTFQE